MESITENNEEMIFIKKSILDQVFENGGMLPIKPDGYSVESDEIRSLPMHTRFNVLEFGISDRVFTFVKLGESTFDSSTHIHLAEMTESFFYEDDFFNENDVPQGSRGYIEYIGNDVSK